MTKKKIQYFYVVFLRLVKTGLDCEKNVFATLHVKSCVDSKL